MSIRSNDPPAAADGSPPAGGRPGPDPRELLNEAVASWQNQYPTGPLLRWRDLHRSRRRSLIALSVIAAISGFWAGIGAGKGFAEVGGVLEHGAAAAMALFTAGLLLIVMWSFDRLVDHIVPRLWPLLLALTAALGLCALTGIALPLNHGAGIDEVLISSAFPVAIAALTVCASLSLSRSYSAGMRALSGAVAAAVASDQQKDDPK